MWQQRSSCRRIKGPEAQLVETAADMDLLGSPRRHKSQVWESKKRDDCSVCQVKLSEKRQDLDYQVVESLNLVVISLCQTQPVKSRRFQRATWVLPYGNLGATLGLQTLTIVDCQWLYRGCLHYGASTSAQSGDNSFFDVS